MKNPRQIRIFVVEDNDFYRELLKYNITLNPDYEVSTFSSGKEMLENLYTTAIINILIFPAGFQWR
jgi:DNA-binding NtrC family response regulator